MPVITLTTEWRPDDIYNGIIKGKLCSLCPGITIVDNASGISPFNISHASFVIRNTYLNYPEGSVHIICVQSEAQKNENYLVVSARGHFFISNDNGIFNLILNSDPEEIIKIECEGCNDELEIFAKAAAGIVKGKKPSELGTPLKAISEKLPLRATIDKEVIIGSIIFIDSYGNAISNITREIFSRVFENNGFRISVKGNKNFTEHISQRYDEVPIGDILARFNSLDLLEISINGADLAELLDLSIGSAVRVEMVTRTIPPDKLF